PKGMDKMLVDALGEITVTNDGVTILEQMNIEHPSAKMVVEIAKTQEAEVGDGTTTAVVLAGEMLKNAEQLIDKEIHPTIIARGYRMAAEKAQELLDAMAKPVTLKDDATLIKIAHTAMTGKGAEDAKDHLAQLVVKGVKAVAENGVVRRERVKIEKRIGGAVENTSLISGIVLDKERAHSGMPNKVEKAKIALLDSPLEIKNTEIDARISITDPEKLQAFLDMEEGMLKKMVNKVVASGANVLFCQKGIDDLAQHFLAKNGILAARRVKKSDLERLARATGGKIVTNLDDLSTTDLGAAGSVEEIFHGDEGMLYVQDCPDAKAVTLLVRGGTEHVVDEIKRALEDAIGDVVAAVTDGKVVAGAGSPEVELSKGLLEYATKLSGREQLAVKAFAEAMEIIPVTLAENAGIDPIDALTMLKSAHEKGKASAGINVFTGKQMNAWTEGVIEPLKIKTQAVSSASEVAIMILRIDDVIASEEETPGPAPQMPQG
ncbi:thermosome subunit, partial [Candidatus Woesearchaeota archaeon]|nr:thermosome subunit [Candidatus Woesearchaeota archaeon]